ncbi:hypothetical protein [Saccharothrix sp. NRRL B-16314]|uniref:hypothetical protein n=1 Tax=Saccharothrix sp. NRRL B-16314 TaxID=1463825 RepID=UPI000689F5A3|nr:hypothetical protein [Saccharothrix sp. NRRL B-16314]
MATKLLTDPFAGIEDAPEPTPAETRASLLKSTRRGYVPLRKEFVQRRRGEGSEPRSSLLAQFVTNRRHRPLDAFLLLHALYPITRDEPLDLKTWARLLSVGNPCTPNLVGKSFSVLEEMGLVERAHEGRRIIVRPLKETGDRSPWTRAGEDSGEGGPGFFVIPHAFWTGGLSERLTMPGKAMFLVLLHDTQSPRTPTFHVALERMAEWYGISERTAERGYRELDTAGVLTHHVQKIVDHRHPIGRRTVHHRALVPPFGTRDRMVLQGRTRAAVRKKVEKTQAVGTVGGAQ